MRPRFRQRSERPAALQDQHGSALVLALVVLVILTALALTLLTIGGQEPGIARNHADTLRARYLAEAGVELALARLTATAGSWDIHIAQASCSVGAVMIRASLPGLPAANGEFTVRVRNDCEPGDERLTGVPPEPPTNATTDSNGTLIVASVGEIGPTTHSVMVVVSAGGQSGLPSPSGQTVASPAVIARNWSDR